MLSREAEGGANSGDPFASWSGWGAVYSRAGTIVPQLKAVLGHLLPSVLLGPDHPESGLGRHHVEQMASPALVLVGASVATPETPALGIVPQDTLHAQEHRRCWPPRA